MGELKWYALRAVSGQEKKAKNYLETEIAHLKMQDAVEQVLIPMEKIYEVRNGKKKVRERNFFPGYMLVHADLSSGEVLHTIKSTPGIIGFLEEKGKEGGEKIPVPLRQSEVNRILGKVEENDQEEVVVDSVFSVGESLTVIDGPFSGFTGTVEEVFKEKKKLKVMVKIFGRNTPVELGYGEVEKIA
jgi:transcriptional antiterminator NusG